MSDYLSAAPDGPVALLISGDGSRVNAMTVRCFSEVAHFPTTLWVSIARASWTHELIEATGAFTLALLHDGQRGLATACGNVSGRQTDKCADLPLYRHATGHRFLSGALSSTACRVREKIRVDDHTLMIADILGGDFDSRHIVLRRHLLVSDLR